MARYCDHGHLIQESWMECPECCAEHDQREMSDAAQDILTETRKQTEILENLSYQKEKTIKRESTISKLVESQEVAHLAEGRFRMNDLRGAVQLVTEAIKLDPTFVSFYLQRARYFAQQGKKQEAKSDLRHSFKTDFEILVDFENKFQTDDLGEFICLKPELEDLIQDFKSEARKTAMQVKCETETEIERMRLNYTNSPLPEFVKEVENEFQNISALIENGSYLELLNIPKLAQETKIKAVKAIAQMEEAQSEANNSLVKAESMMLGILSSKTLELVPDKVESFTDAKNRLKEAKQLFEIKSYDDYLRCVELANYVINIALSIEQTKKGILSERRSSIEEKLMEKTHKLHQRQRDIENSYRKEIRQQEDYIREQDKIIEKFSITTIPSMIYKGETLIILVVIITVSLLIGKVRYVPLWIFIGILINVVVWIYRFFAGRNAKRAKENAYVRISNILKEMSTARENAKEEYENDKDVVVLIKQLQEINLYN